MHSTRRVFFPSAAGARAFLYSILSDLGRGKIDVRIDPRTASGQKSYRVKPSRYSGERLRTIRARGQEHECARRRRQLVAAA